jgi:hypothetical protein
MGPKTVQPSLGGPPFAEGGIACAWRDSPLFALSGTLIQRENSAVHGAEDITRPFGAGTAVHGRFRRRRQFRSAGRSRLLCNQSGASGERQKYRTG